MEGDAFDALVADIAANGLLEPISLYQGKILDGRSRYAACLAARIQPRFEHFSGGDPIRFVIAKNLHRRHLDESQRAMCAERVVDWRHGGRHAKGPIGLSTLSEAAKSFVVSSRSIKRAHVVAAKGANELVDAVRQGKIAVSVAARLAEVPPQKQVEIVVRVASGALRSSAIMSALKRDGKAERAEWLRANPVVTPDGRYQVNRTRSRHSSASSASCAPTTGLECTARSIGTTWAGTRSKAA